MKQSISQVSTATGERIAYAEVGDGPPLVLAAWWTSHLERDWDDPEFRSFIESLAARHRVVRYDRVGVGLSSRTRRPLDLETEVGFLSTVIGTIADDPIDLVGISCGAPTSIRYTAAFPARVRKLVLIASYLDGADITDEATRHAIIELVRANWGLGSRTLTSVFRPGASAAAARYYTESQRHTATADTAADLLGLTFDLDATPYVDDLDLPVLVVHRRGDHVVETHLGEEVARRVKGAEFHRLDGDAHIPWGEDSGSMLKLINRFLDGGPTTVEAQRHLAAISWLTFDGTRSSGGGDSSAHRALKEVTAAIRHEVDSEGGKLIEVDDRQLIACFGLPGPALEVAIHARRLATQAGLTPRCGIHVGEIELSGVGISGPAVAVAAAVATAAAPSQIIVTSTVADLGPRNEARFVPIGNCNVAALGETWSISKVSTQREPTASDVHTIVAETPNRPRYAFADIVLDADAFELRRGDQLVSIEPQVFDVLKLLVSECGRLVTKQRLLDEIWGSRYVSESVLSSRIRSARAAIGDDGRRQEMIQTVHGRGYRFIAKLF